MWHWEMVYEDKRGLTHSMFSPNGYETMLQAAGAWATQKMEALYGLKLLKVRRLKEVNVVFRKEDETIVSISIGR